MHKHILNNNRTSGRTKLIFHLLVKKHEKTTKFSNSFSNDVFDGIIKIGKLTKWTTFPVKTY